MKVLLVSGIYPPDSGGPASYVPRIAGELAGRGHQVTVLCLGNAASSERGRGFEVHRIRRRQIWFVRVIKTVWKVYRLSGKSDVVYVNGLSSEAVLGALLAGRPTVHKVVGDYAWERAVGRGWFTGTLEEFQTHREKGKEWLFSILKAVRTLPMQHASVLITPSTYLAQLVKSWGIPEARVQVIRNSAPKGGGRGEGAGVRRKGGEGCNWTLATVCRLVPWKGVDGIIDVLRDLPHTRLVVVGDGPERTFLGECARRAGVADRVEFVGEVGAERVAECLAGADAFILNSTYEGLPHAILEAMAEGVPVIATAAGGTGEVVVHERTGLLVPIGDRSSLRAAILRLRREPGLSERLVSEAHTLVRKEYDYDSMITRTEQLLEETAEGACPV
jgi:glycosyltransferase involved in cell wall biosynthesis